VKRSLALAAAAMLGTAAFAGSALAEREEGTRGITIAAAHVEYDSSAPSIVVYVEGVGDLEGVPEPVGESPTSALVERGDDRVTAVFANTQFGGLDLGGPDTPPSQPVPPSSPPPLPPYPSIP
jgi:hypothetical protein